MKWYNHHSRKTWNLKRYNDQWFRCLLYGNVTKARTAGSQSTIHSIWCVCIHTMFVCIVRLYVEKPVCKSPGYCSYRTFPFTARKYGNERVEHTPAEFRLIGCCASLTVFMWHCRLCGGLTSSFLVRTITKIVI